MEEINTAFLLPQKKKKKKNIRLSMDMVSF